MTKKKLSIVRRYITNEIDTLKKVQNEINDLFPKIDEHPSLIELRALASMLDDFYKGIERIFEKIARNIEGKIPKGEFWHSELLLQMSRDFGEMRPAVVSKELAIRLEHYLKFRHLFRNVYGLHLEWDRLQPLLQSFEKVFNDFSDSIKEFLNFLDTMIEATKKGK